MSLTIGLTAWLAIAVAPILLVATYLVLRDARSTSTHARPPDAANNASEMGRRRKRTLQLRAVRDRR